MYDKQGNLYNYETFLNEKKIPIKYKEFHNVIKAIPSGIQELMKSHLAYQACVSTIGELTISSVNLLDAKCTNKLI